MKFIVIIFILFNSLFSWAQVDQSRANFMTDAELEQKIKNRFKDPFMIPNDIYLVIKKKQIGKSGDEVVDELAHPRQRWTLKYYKLIAVIWNVSQPKAMLQDKEGTVHMFTIGDYIGNRKGVVQSISDGRVTIIESGKEIVIRMISAPKESSGPVAQNQIGQKVEGQVQPTASNSNQNKPTSTEAGGLSAPLQNQPNR